MLEKLLPIVHRGLSKSVPVLLKAAGSTLHPLEQCRLFTHVAKIVAVCFITSEADHFTVRKIAQQRDISFSDRTAQVTSAGQFLSLVKKIPRRDVGVDVLAENDSALGFRLNASAESTSK